MGNNVATCNGANSKEIAIMLSLTAVYYPSLIFTDSLNDQRKVIGSSKSIYWFSERLAKIHVRFCESCSIGRRGWCAMEQTDPIPLVRFSSWAHAVPCLCFSAPLQLLIEVFRYYLPDWKKYYGQNWALDMCIEWFEYDGKRRNFQMDLTKDIPCPCKISQVGQSQATGVWAELWRKKQNRVRFPVSQDGTMLPIFRLKVVFGLPS